MLVVPEFYPNTHNQLSKSNFFCTATLCLVSKETHEGMYLGTIIEDWQNLPSVIEINPTQNVWNQELLRPVSWS